MARVILITLVTLASACGGPGYARRTEDPVIVPAQPPPRAAAQPPRTEIALADTPITPTAAALTRAALAGVFGGPFEDLPVPTRRPVVTSAAEVDWSPRIDGRPRSMEVLCFAFELELILKRGEPPDVAEGPVRWGSIRATLALSRNGLRLVDLRPRAMEPDPEGGTIPVGFEGLDRLISTLLSDLSDGDMGPYTLNEEDRRLLDNDPIWARVATDFSTGQLAQVRQMVRGLPHVPLGVRLDDVSVLVRDERERLFSLSMDFDPVDGSYALSTSPLISVVQLWPR